jgi:leukotriene-A4 hydrolase
MSYRDPHSCWLPGTAAIKHIQFVLDVDFDKKVISGNAIYQFDRKLGNDLLLDTRELAIEKVTTIDGTRILEWSLGEETFLGRVLTIAGVNGLESLRIEFSTAPTAGALQWLAPEQTAGKKHPYVFSQCQAILARTVFPCQDSPSVRFTYDAMLRIPRGLSAVMAAEFSKSEHDKDGERFYFTMRHPIPSYLFALAVGNITSREVGSRCHVFAEPEMLEAASHEFSDMSHMLTSAEELFGHYEWNKFDVLVMPPSFPYGGMENPTLTFLTPTLIAGDRSLVSVVAHELAHSWTGNLVTNATWEDFWLNEGWTVYAERRIVERLYSTELANLQAVSGRNDLLTSFRNFGGDQSPLTKLKTELAGMDPDDAYSSVPYEKGFLFLMEIERTVGRKIFDKFILEYMRQFRFTSITTEIFVQFLKEKLSGIEAKVNLNRWLHEPGLPETAPEFHSAMIDEVRAAQRRWDQGDSALDNIISKWNIHQKVLFLEELPPRQSHEICERIRTLFDVDRTLNCEILLPWYCIAAASGYQGAYEAMRAFLSTVGRGKYLRPLYRALHQNPGTRAMAAEWFAEFKDGYHYVGRSSVERILSQA